MVYLLICKILTFKFRSLTSSLWLVRINEYETTEYNVTLNVLFPAVPCNVLMHSTVITDDIISCETFTKNVSYRVPAKHKMIDRSATKPEGGAGIRTWTAVCSDSLEWWDQG